LDTWGNFRFPTELDASRNRFAFTGHIFDTETGLYSAKARYFDPKLGRFLTQDSYLGSIDEPPSLHRYLYANDNPTTYLDLTGRAGVKQTLIQAQDAFTGGVIGVGELLASPGVLTYNMLGAAGYTLSGNRPEYRQQWENWNAFTERIGTPTAERLVTVAFEEAEQHVTDFTAAIERGDSLAAGHAMGGFVGQSIFMGESGSTVRVTPGAALQPVGGAPIPVGGTVSVSASAPAAGVFMSTPQNSSGIIKEGKDSTSTAKESLPADKAKAKIKRQQQLKANAQQGAAFEPKAKQQFAKGKSNVREQVTIKSNESGTKTRVDAIGVDEATGQPALGEFKSSETADLTKNQAKAHPEIARSGGVVVGAGKPGFPGGTEIPPTATTVLRPKNIHPEPPPEP